VAWVGSWGRLFSGGMSSGIGRIWGRPSLILRRCSPSIRIIRSWCTRWGGAYDTAGQEETARGYYERALALGLDGDVLRRCLCQYASTLRWLGELDESLAVLDRAREEFPDSDSVRVFRALTLNDAKRGDEAVAELLTVVTGHPEVTDLGRWATGLRGLARWLADGRPE
jgi:tetratricopeptide (TPR) repeat protein